MPKIICEECGEIWYDESWVSGVLCIFCDSRRTTDLAISHKDKSHRDKSPKSQNLKPKNHKQKGKENYHVK